MIDLFDLTDCFGSSSNSLSYESSSLMKSSAISRVLSPFLSSPLEATFFLLAATDVFWAMAGFDALETFFSAAFFVAIPPALVAKVAASDCLSLEALRYCLSVDF